MAKIGELIQSFRDRGHSFGVSTDIGGFAVGPLPFMVPPDHASAFWRDCRSKIVDGGEELHFNLELIPWRHMLWFFYPHAVLHKLEQLVDAPIAGFHAQPGIAKSDLEQPLNLIKLALVTPNMLSLLETVRLAERLQHPTYTNVHAPYIQYMPDQTIQKIRDIQRKTTIAIETHTEPFTLENAERQRLKLARSGVTEVVKIFDVYHVLTSLSKQHDHLRNDYPALWKAMLCELHEAGQCIIHLPGGPDERDAVPILNEGLLTDDMLIDLGNVADEHDDYFDFEFQRTPFELGKPTRSNRRRGKIMLRRALRTGIVRPIKPIRYFPMPGSLSPVSTMPKNRPLS